jgi:hypothetical protein
MYCSTRIYWFLLNVALNKSRNTQESFFIHGQMQFVGKKTDLCMRISIAPNVHNNEFMFLSLRTPKWREWEAA